MVFTIMDGNFVQKEAEKEYLLKDVAKEIKQGKYEIKLQ